MRREEALSLVREWTESESLVRHMLAVEAAMRAYARHFGADEELWGLTGLIHDADYERWPSEHPAHLAAELERRGESSEIIHAIMSHGDHTGVPRESRLDRALYASDEITGLITAAALMRPTRLEGLGVASVRKKMKDKRFAAGVNREHITAGAEALGVPLDEHISRIIAAMQGIREDLEL